MKIAALDLGTNTFLCLIAEGNKNGISRVISDSAEVVRLGQGIDSSGEFHPDALKRARECLQKFKAQIDNSGVDRILAMATSAARDAKNGDELFKIGSDLGIPIEIIPGEDEARITYQGAMVGLKSSNKKTLVIDVGGGSTEFILGDGLNYKYAKSLNIGGVRLTEKFITHQPICLSEQKSLTDYVKSNIAIISKDLMGEKIDQVVAVAGTPTSIAAIEVGGFSHEKVDGYEIDLNRLSYWQNEFANTNVEEKKKNFNLGGRADIIYAGATILKEALCAFNLSSMIVSTKGVRFGVAIELFKR